MCQVGKVEPIWEKDQITETYCRCPDNSYGFTCQEKFYNPCEKENSGYSRADDRIAHNYFIKCNWGTPYLIKCPPSTRYEQSLEVCIWTSKSYDGKIQAFKAQIDEVAAAASTGYNQQLPEVLPYQPTYQQPGVVQSSQPYGQSQMLKQVSLIT